jgi:hypothetical protein
MPAGRSAECRLSVFHAGTGADELRAHGLARRARNGPGHAQARRCSVPDPNLERVDSFASSLQAVEDPAGVGQGARVAAVEPEESQHSGEERRAVDTVIEIDDPASRFPDIGGALSRA